MCAAPRADCPRSAGPRAAPRSPGPERVPSSHVSAATRQPTFSGIATATLAALCWGSATVMSKGALDQVPPIALLVIQLASSLTFLWTLLLVRGVRTGAIRDALRIAWLGLLEPGFAFVL